MVKQLVLIAALCGTVQANTYSYEEYLAQKGTVKVGAKKEKTSADKAESAGAAIIKLEAKNVKHSKMIRDILNQHSEKISKPVGDNADRAMIAQRASRVRLRSLGIIK